MIKLDIDNRLLILKKTFLLKKKTSFFSHFVYSIFLIAKGDQPYLV